MSLRPRQVDFESVWHNLRETSFGVITLGNIERQTWNDRFADVYDLCVAYPEPQASRLYSEVKTFLKCHVESLQKNIASSDDNNLLASYHQAWLVYNQGSIYLDKLYMYLNIQYLKKKKMSLAELIYGSFEVDNDTNALEVRELALSMWRRYMIQPFQDQLVELLLQCIISLRTGSLTDGEQSIVKDTIQSLVDVEEYKVKPLELYETLFERAFLESSGRYFRELAASLLQTHNVCGYMARVLQISADEQVRCIGYLNASSVDRVLAELRARLVEDHLSWILAETPAMVSEEREVDLRNLYDLLKPLQRSEPLQNLVRMVEEHIRAKGVNMLVSANGVDNPMAFVDTVLAIHDKYSTVMTQVFRSDQSMFGALCRACTAVVNYRSAGQTHCAAAELLVKYCDLLLKRSSKTISETSLDEKLGFVVTIFKFVEDKDAFQKHYQKFLCKRLMYDSTASIDSEELMVSKFKQACGYDFTNKLSQMLRDISVSVDHTNKFAVFLKDNDLRLQHGVAVKVIQSGAWPVPASGTISFQVPQLLEQCVQQFELFYKGKFSGRRLSWLHHLSQAEVRLLYLPRMYLVTLHTFAMAVLVLFDTADSLSLEELSAATALPLDHLIRNVNALVDCHLLECRSAADTATVDQTSAGNVYSLNMSFSCKRTRFRVQTAAPVREQLAESEQTQREIDEGRKMCLQAAIVRIMKARKRLRHNELVQEVLTQTGTLFTPQMTVIKKCIEVLIDKDYIARVAGNSDEYSYVA